MFNKTNILEHESKLKKNIYLLFKFIKKILNFIENTQLYQQKTTINRPEIYLRYEYVQ